MMTEEQALERLTALCSRSEHCQREMLDKMAKWEIPDDVQTRIMDYLISEKYIDDERYCRGFISDKREFNQWGRYKIEQALYMKGIGKDISGPIFDEIPVDEWLNILRPLIKEKRRTVTGRNDYEITQKLLRFAVGRGFSYDEAMQCVEEG